MNIPEGGIIRIGVGFQCMMRALFYFSLDTESLLSYTPRIHKDLEESIHIRVDVRKRGENPPLPRSREGNENPQQPLSRLCGVGRRVSRVP